MKLVKKFWNSLSHPSPNQPFPFIVMQNNQEIIIEHVDELLSFTDNTISIYSSFGTVEINGEHLTILVMKQSELVIKGHISTINFYRDERRKL